MDKNKEISNYVNSRLASVGDDRLDRNKLERDALLRGAIGLKSATKAIKAVDDLKSIG